MNPPCVILTQLRPGAGLSDVLRSIKNHLLSCHAVLQMLPADVYLLSADVYLLSADVYFLSCPSLIQEIPAVKTKISFLQRFHPDFTAR